MCEDPEEMIHDPRGEQRENTEVASCSSSPLGTKGRKMSIGGFRLKKKNTFDSKMYRKITEQVAEGN
jgi:hypothetical protein